jgi:hypothetical protein
MVGFAFIGDFELGCIFIENHAADGVSKHYVSLNLMEESTFYLLWLVVKKRFKHSGALCGDYTRLYVD